MILDRRRFLWSGTLAALLLVIPVDERKATLRRRYGCYYPLDGSYSFDTVEDVIGMRFDWYSIFASFDSVARYQHDLPLAARSGHDILVAFAPKSGSQAVAFADILAGRWDQFLTGWFAYLNGLPCQVVIRWAWEMNGAFQPYNPNYSGANSSHCESAAQYASVWRHVVALQRAIPGPHNTHWFFCANQNDTSPIPMEDFYPGNDVVQIVGYDSYNGLNGKYMTAAQTLEGQTNSSQASAYDRVCALDTNAAVWIGETGCVNEGDPRDWQDLAAGHSQAQWFADLITCTTLPRLTTINFFDASGSRNWRFDTSPSTVSAIRQALT